MTADSPLKLDERTEPKWIAFREIPAPGVTKRWEVVARQGDLVLGRVAWSNGWRRYVLQPSFTFLTEWEQDCLRDVANFIERQTIRHKANRYAERQAP